MCLAKRKRTVRWRKKKRCACDRQPVMSSLCHCLVRPPVVAICICLPSFPYVSGNPSMTEQTKHLWLMLPLHFLPPPGFLIMAPSTCLAFQFEGLQWQKQSTTESLQFIHPTTAGDSFLLLLHLLHFYFVLLHYLV